MSPPQPPASPCFSVTPSDFLFDLSQSTVLHSNLGGFTTGVPPVLRFANVGLDPATGRTVDLEVSNSSMYQPWNTAVNGLASGGRVGQINLEATHQGEDPDTPRYVDLVFSFVDSASSAPVVLNRFEWSVLDFDQGLEGNGAECVSVQGYSSVQLAVESEVVEANDPVDPSATAFCASQTGTNGEQPATTTITARRRAMDGHALPLTVRQRLLLQVTTRQTRWRSRRSSRLERCS